MEFICDPLGRFLERKRECVKFKGEDEVMGLGGYSGH